MVFRKLPDGQRVNGVPWTPNEKAALRKMYYREPWEAICAAIPSHPRYSVQKMANLMGLKRRRIPRISKWPFIERLHDVRERACMTRRQLAKMMGYHETMLGRWERGDAVPSVRRLVDWCEALNVKIEIANK